MKKLLSLVALVALATALPANQAVAGYRGAFDHLTAQSAAFNNGIANGCQTPALRPAPFRSIDGVAKVEQWYCFTTRSQAVGFESSREIWMARNNSRVGLNIDVGAIPGPMNPNGRQPLKKDPTGLISYLDPAWSPDGKYLMWIESDANLTHTAIMYQEYKKDTVADNVPPGTSYLAPERAVAAGTPIGSPVALLGPTVGVRYRHPDWSPDGTSIVFDSDAAGLSVDLYTMGVFPPSAPVRRTFVDNRAEQNPAWATDGVRIAYDTNKFGPNVIEILNTSTNTVSLAETNFATVSHNNPDWDALGNIFYDAPQSEDNQQNPNIWKLNPITQTKCEIIFDERGDANVSVSTQTNVTADGIQYGLFLFESQAAQFGLAIWRANAINSCAPALAMGAEISPRTISLDNSCQANDVTLGLSFPPETEAAGYQCNSLNGPKEGVRMRLAPFPSPTLLGLTANAKGNGGGQAGLPDFSDQGTNGINVKFARRTLVNRIVALGLVNQDVPLTARAYSNITGRTFQGFAFLRINANSLAGSIVKLEQNSPNPFNPVTQIKYATSKAGHVTLRIYNVQGALIKTLADKNVEAGSHEATWDGRNTNGAAVSSGVYYAKIFSEGGNSDVVKMVMAK